MTLALRYIYTGAMVQYRSPRCMYAYLYLYLRPDYLFIFQSISSPGVSDARMRENGLASRDTTTTTTTTTTTIAAHAGVAIAVYTVYSLFTT